jgi:hypothetical protein
MVDEMQDAGIDLLDILLFSSARGFRQFLSRGIDKVKAEWAMICTAHNLRKLALVVA